MLSRKWRSFCLSLNVLIKDLNFLSYLSVEKWWKYKYRQVSNIRCTKSQHFKNSRDVLQLSLPNPLKPDVKSRMKM